MALKAKQYIFLTAGAIVFIALLVLAFFEYRQIVYLLNDDLFWTWSLSITGILIVSCFLVLTRFVKPLVARIQLFMFCLLIFGFFTPAFILGTNRLFHQSGWNERKFEFFSLEAKGVGTIDKSQISSETYPGGYYVIFVRKDKLDRIFTQKARFLNKERGEIITLFTRRGLWGFEYVTWN